MDDKMAHITQFSMTQYNLRYFLKKLPVEIDEEVGKNLS